MQVTAKLRNLISRVGLCSLFYSCPTSVALRTPPEHLGSLAGLLECSLVLQAAGKERMFENLHINKNKRRHVERTTYRVVRMDRDCWFLKEQAQRSLKTVKQVTRVRFFEYEENSKSNYSVEVMCENQNNVGSTSNCQCAAWRSCRAWSLAQPATITNWFIIACSFNLSILVEIRRTSNNQGPLSATTLKNTKWKTRCFSLWQSRVIIMTSAKNKPAHWLINIAWWPDHDVVKVTLVWQRKAVEQHTGNSGHASLCSVCLQFSLTAVHKLHWLH